MSFPLIDTCSEVTGSTNNNIKSQPQIVASPLVMAKAIEMHEKAVALRQVRAMLQGCPIPFRAWAGLLLEYLKNGMESEITNNWVNHAEQITKSSFVNKLMLSLLTNGQDMWSKNGFFPKTVATLQTELHLEVTIVKVEAPQDKAIPHAKEEDEAPQDEAIPRAKEEDKAEGREE